MDLKDILIKERDRIVAELAELDGRREHLLRDLEVANEGLAKLGEADEGQTDDAPPPKRKRGENAGIERTRKLLSEHPEGLTVPQIAERLGLNQSYTSNIISHMNNVEKVLKSAGKHEGKNLWVLAA